MNIISMSNGLDPDLELHIVGSDLGPNCLQRLLADDKKMPQARKELTHIGISAKWEYLFWAQTCKYFSIDLHFSF